MRTLLLPGCMCKIFMCKWLETEAVRRLDWAYCVRRGHEDFRKVLVGIVLSKAMICDTPTLWWMLLRKIYCKEVTAIHVAIKDYDALLAQYLTFGATHFRSVHAIGLHFESQAVQELSLNCSALINFSCDLISIAQLARLLANNSRTLQTVETKILYDTPEDSTIDDVIPRLDSITSLSLQIELRGCAALARELIAKSRFVEKLCVNVLNEDFQFTIQFACPRLRSLKVRNRPMRALSASVATHCISVVNLDLHLCYSLTDEDVHILAAHLPFLCTLDLRRCMYLTDRSLQHLGDHRANSLQLLLLGFNPHIKRAQMNLLIKQCKRCNTDLQLRCIQSFYYEDRNCPPALCDDETTVAVARSDLSDKYVRNIVMHNYVEVVCVSEFDFQLTKEGMDELCAKLPRLSTVVVYGRSTYHTEKMAPHFPHLTFTTCPSMAEYELVNLTL